MLKHCHKIRTDHKPGLNLHQTIRDESSLDRGHCCGPLWKLPCASPSWWRHIPRFIIWIYMTWASVIASWCSQKINLEPCLAWKISSSEKKDSTSCPLCFLLDVFSVFANSMIEMQTHRMINCSQETRATFARQPMRLEWHGWQDCAGRHSRRMAMNHGEFD